MPRYNVFDLYKKLEARYPNHFVIEKPRDMAILYRLANGQKVKIADETGIFIDWQSVDCYTLQSIVDNNVHVVSSYLNGLL